MTYLEPIIMKSHNQKIPFEYIKKSELRPLSGVIPYIRPNQSEIDLARSTQLVATITVKASSDEEGKYDLLQGEKAWFTAQLANVEIIDCKVIDEPLSAQDEMQLITNELNSYTHEIKIVTTDPIHKAKILQENVKQVGNQERYAAQNNTTQGAISHELNLLKLSPAVQKLLKKGSLHPSKARKLHRIKNRERQLELANSFAKEKYKASHCWEKTQEAISDELNLLKLSPSVQLLIGKGALHYHKVRNLHRIQDTDLQLKLANFFVQEKYKASRCLEVTQSFIEKESGKKPKDEITQSSGIQNNKQNKVNEINMGSLERTLQHQLNMDVKIIQNKDGSGKYIISYSDSIQRDYILEQLGHKSEDELY